jgi:peroxiredoxin
LKGILLRAAGLVAIVGLSLFASLHRDPGPGLALTRPAPSLRLPSLAGGTIELSAFRGHVVVLNFWASWCPPCVEEMPSLEGLHRALGVEGLVVLGVSVDENERELRRFVERYGLTFPILRDPSGVFAAEGYLTQDFPTTFVIDHEGILRARYIGPARWDAPGALEHFRERLWDARAAAPSDPPATVSPSVR